MSKQQQQTTTGGVSTLGVVQIVFIVLKLVGVIDWSWWAVFIPLYISIAIIVLLLVIGLLIIGVTK